ncbi:hypothetical protein PybrP1_000431 [[Pythium] brassicae (nom. inval.)]|nr:hypothetical protein PybrP1_000431 [[Pythium] brassicae (nom. inval.)]
MDFALISSMLDSTSEPHAPVGHHQHGRSHLPRSRAVASLGHVALKALARMNLPLYHFRFHTLSHGTTKLQRPRQARKPALHKSQQKPSLRQTSKQANMCDDLTSCLCGSLCCICCLSASEPDRRDRRRRHHHDARRGPVYVQPVVVTHAPMNHGHQHPNGYYHVGQPGKKLR